MTEDGSSIFHILTRMAAPGRTQLLSRLLHAFADVEPGDVAAVAARVSRELSEGLGVLCALTLLSVDGHSVEGAWVHDPKGARVDAIRSVLLTRAAARGSTHDAAFTSGEVIPKLSLSPSFQYRAVVIAIMIWWSVSSSETFRSWCWKSSVRAFAGVMLSARAMR